MAVAARELVADEVRVAKPVISGELIERAAPVSLAGDQRLPVLAALEPLLAAGGLRRGSVVAVEGSSSLALALGAAASAGGSWCAAVGRPALGLVAAAELGIVLERFPLVPVPDPSAGARPGGWAWVVATLLDTVDLVIAWPPVRDSAAVRPADARRLAARARERGSVLVVASGAGAATGVGGWPEAPDVRLAVTRSEWHGLDRVAEGGAGVVAGVGAGRLRGRRVEVVAGGRGAATRQRRATLWLPAPDGGVAVASNAGAADVGADAGADTGAGAVTAAGVVAAAGEAAGTDADAGEAAGTDADAGEAAGTDADAGEAAGAGAVAAAVAGAGAGADADAAANADADAAANADAGAGAAAFDRGWGRAV